MVTVVQGKVCAKNHPDRLNRLATIHQRYRRTDGFSYGIGLDLTVGQKLDKGRAKYDFRKYYFTNRVVNAWNCLPDHGVLS